MGRSAAGSRQGGLGVAKFTAGEGCWTRSSLSTGVSLFWRPQPQSGLNAGNPPPDPAGQKGWGVTGGVIFDMDGVLVASGPAHAASWRLLARRHGIGLSEERFRESFGRPSRDIVRMIWGEDLSDEQVRQIDDEKERIYRELISGIVPLSIGTREVLHALSRAGFVLAVATSGPPENLGLVLRETGLERYFAATVHGFDVREGKPAPDCFLLAAERAGLAAGACVVVEDAPVGIQAARAAGMRVIALAGTHPRATLAAAGAARVLDRLDELTPELVRSLLDGDRNANGGSSVDSSGGRSATA